MSFRLFAAVSLSLALSVLGGALTASAQGLDPSEIEEAVRGMRAAGMPESQIEQFLQSVEGARKSAEIIESGEASFGITPEDAERMALERKQREFEAEHGDKPDATVWIGSERYALKVLDCKGDPAMYGIAAKGPPSGDRLAFHAGRSSIGTTNIDFRIGHHTSYNLEAGSSASHFDGRRLRFDGLLKKSHENQPTGENVRVRVEASCR